MPCYPVWRAFPRNLQNALALRLLAAVILLDSTQAARLPPVCRPAAGTVQHVAYCSPAVRNLANSLANITSNSFLRKGDDFCWDEGAFAGLHCNRSVTDLSPRNLLQPGVAWQSATLTSLDSQVEVILRLPASLVVFSVAVTIPNRDRVQFPIVTRFHVLVASADGEPPLRTAATFADRCDGDLNCLPLVRAEGANNVTVYSKNDLVSGLSNVTRLSQTIKQRLVSEIRLRFDRLLSITASSHPDERDDLNAYRYYIADRLEVVGTCWCNGHGEDCAENGSCLCQNNTAGETCESCREGFQKRHLSTGFICEEAAVSATTSTTATTATTATSTSAPTCNCSRVSSYNNSCQTITYKEKGQCNCFEGYIGLNCSQCADGYFQNSSQHCIACNCSIASESTSCTEDGQCSCKAGVMGAKCDRCLENFYAWTNKGCTPCACHRHGASSEQCNVTGHCRCKVNAGIGGRHCNQCLPGFTSFADDGCVAIQSSTSTPETTSLVSSPGSTVSSSKMTVQQKGEEKEDFFKNSTIVIIAFSPVPILLLALFLVVIRKKRRDHRDANCGGKSLDPGGPLQRQPSFYQSVDILSPVLKDSSSSSSVRSTPLGISENGSIGSRTMLRPSSFERAISGENSIRHSGRRHQRSSGMDISEISEVDPADRSMTGEQNLAQFGQVNVRDSSERSGGQKTRAEKTSSRMALLFDRSSQPGNVNDEAMTPLNDLVRPRSIKDVSSPKSDNLTFADQPYSEITVACEGNRVRAYSISEPLEERFRLKRKASSASITPGRTVIQTTPTMATSSQITSTTPTLTTSSQIISTTPTVATSSQITSTTPTVATSSQITSPVTPGKSSPQMAIPTTNMSEQTDGNPLPAYSFPDMAAKRHDRWVKRQKLSNGGQSAFVHPLPESKQSKNGHMPGVVSSVSTSGMFNSLV